MKSAKKWYFKDKSTGNVQGPFEEEEVQRWYRMGRLKNQVVSTSATKGFKRLKQAIPSSYFSISTTGAVKVNGPAVVAKLVDYAKNVDMDEDTTEQLSAWAMENGEEATNKLLRERYGVDLNTISKTVKRKKPQKEAHKPKLEYSAFLSHAWGKDKQGRDNHKRVQLIFDELKKEGLEAWFDSANMKGNIAKDMSDGIEKSKTVVVFITESYMAKVNGDEDDFCKSEFQYAMRRKTTKNIIPVVMEKGMLNTSNWIGPLGLHLGSSLYIDMSTKSALKTNLTTLLEELRCRDLETQE